VRGWAASGKLPQHVLPEHRLDEAVGAATALFDDRLGLEQFEGPADLVGVPAARIDAFPLDDPFEEVNFPYTKLIRD
jgi:hypothetical protein